MELNVKRFVGEINENLLCPICLNVLNDPLQDDREHLFCRQCIFLWMRTKACCPIDRSVLTTYSLKPASRLLKNILAELKITCDYKEYGCNAVVKLDSLNSHLRECIYQPGGEIECPNGCELTIKRIELKEHNCIRELKRENKELQNEIIHLKHKHDETEVEIKSLKEALIKLSNNDNLPNKLNNGISSRPYIQYFLLAISIFNLLFFINYVYRVEFTYAILLFTFIYIIYRNRTTIRSMFPIQTLFLLAFFI